MVMYYFLLDVTNRVDVSMMFSLEKWNPSFSNCNGSTFSSKLIKSFSYLLCLTLEEIIFVVLEKKYESLQEVHLVFVAGKNFSVSGSGLPFGNLPALN